MALRIAFGETIPCDEEDDCILFVGFKSNSLQSRPGFAETRIGKSRSIISSFLVVRSLTLKRKQIWSSLAFAPTFADLRQLLKHVNQILKILTICFFCFKAGLNRFELKVLKHQKRHMVHLMWFLWDIVNNSWICICHWNHSGLIWSSRPYRRCLLEWSSAWWKRMLHLVMPLVFGHLSDVVCMT